MADVPAWVYAVAPPLWAFGATYVIRTVRFWPDLMARWNERVRTRATIDGELYERLAARVEVLEKKVAACEADRDHWKSRAIIAEAIVQGQGEVRQQSSRVVASDRLARRSEEGGGE